LARVVHPVVTTQFVLLEVADAFARPAHRGWYRELIHEFLSAADVTVVPASSELFEAGNRLYHDRPDKPWSLTDCISFSVMQSHGLREALTNDHHFEQAGFVRLLR
jgi:predicted nucleic acid-binding protein